MESIVIYFSYSGNTREMAKIAAEYTHSDICELLSPEPLPKDQKILHDNVVVEKLFPRQRSPLRMPADTDKYAVFIVGAPLWIGTYPGFFLDHLRSINWRGRMVYPFISFGGTVGNYYEELIEICRGARLAPPFEMHSGSRPEEVRKFKLWLGRINNFTGNIK